jgi:CBS-domain-containing membrane protein
LASILSADEVFGTHRMCDAHIHRVVIVDERRRPVGVVSSMDVLAAVARMDRFQEVEDL